MNNRRFCQHKFVDVIGLFLLEVACNGIFYIRLIGFDNILTKTNDLFEHGKHIYIN